MRNHTISITKGIAIILMVAAHANCPTGLTRFVYMFHMPLFFITAGYFFNISYLNNEKAFIVKRFKGLYLPFLKWSLFFLVIHNLMFAIGILNESYGNSAGGVTHPYTWYQFQQRVWNCVFSMSGYDEFLSGTFWFFRALLLSSIAFLVLFKLLRKVKYLTNDIEIAWSICGIALFIAGWKTLSGLSISNVAQGGYRDIMGLFFFGIGFLYAHYQSKIRENWLLTIAYFIILYIGVGRYHSSMAFNATFEQFIKLPVPAVLGFLMVHHVSGWINKNVRYVRDALIYVGEHTIYIFAFHIVAFKVISLIKILWYDLDFAQIGCHMAIHANADKDYFWIVYTIGGVTIPLFTRWAYHRSKPLFIPAIKWMGGSIKQSYKDIKEMANACKPTDDV